MSNAQLGGGDSASWFPSGVVVPTRVAGRGTGTLGSPGTGNTRKRPFVHGRQCVSPQANTTPVRVGQARAFNPRCGWKVRVSLCSGHGAAQPNVQRMTLVRQMQKRRAFNFRSTYVPIRVYRHQGSRARTLRSCKASEEKGRESESDDHQLPETPPALWRPVFREESWSMCRMTSIIFAGTSAVHRQGQLPLSPMSLATNARQDLSYLASPCI